MERSTFPLIHLYIEMGPNVWANELDIRFKLALQLRAKLDISRQIALLSDIQLILMAQYQQFKINLGCKNSKSIEFELVTNNVFGSCLMARTSRLIPKYKSIINRSCLCKGVNSFVI
jgi:hypothetical protein